MAFTLDTLQEEDWSVEGLIQEFQEHDYIQRDWERVNPLALSILEDLKSNTKVDFYLYFGRCPRKIVDNYDALLHAQKFGYTIEDMVIDEHGWANFEFEEEQTILVFQTGKNVNDKVEYHIARSRNNLYVVGWSYTTVNAGSYTSPHMYVREENIFKSKKEAEIFIVGYLIEEFEREIVKFPKSAYLHAALKALKDKKSKIKFGDFVQLQLFA